MLFWPWPFCFWEVRVIKRRSFSFVYPDKFRIALKNMLEGNTDDKEKVRMPCLSSYDLNHYLKNTPDACLNSYKTI